MLNLNKNTAARKKLLEQLVQECAACGGSCCFEELSPFKPDKTVAEIRQNSDIILLEKGLRLDADFNQRFRENVRQNLKQVGEEFAEKALKFLESSHFSIDAFVKVYKKVSEIKAHSPKDKGNCSYLTIGRGCIGEEYKPRVCQRILRGCFNLEERTYVEGLIIPISADCLVEFVREDLKLSSDYVIPKIIISADQRTKERIAQLKKQFRVFGQEVLELGEITYSELCVVGDALIIPPIDGPFARYWDCPLVFVDKLNDKSTANSKFDFGLYTCQVFKVEN